MEEILVPADRIGVFNRNTIEEIEKDAGVRLERKDNIIIVSGEGMEVYQAALVVKAIARGFAPVRAMKILLKEMQLEIIEIGGSENQVKRIKSRIIGTGGKARRRMEYLSDCMISVYGNTVSIIGPPEKIFNAKKAIEMIIRGSSHNTAYLFLERQSKSISV